MNDIGKNLAVYIHWPFCKAKCPYCDFNSHVRDRVEQERWKSALHKELDHFAALVPDRMVTSIFFGGGTPSLMPGDTVAALIERVHRSWPVAEHLEITLEANPTSVESGKFRDFRRAGVNRVSLGVQAFNAADLAFLGRQHSADEAFHAITLAAEHFDRYSFDLIYARPGQTVAAWEAELAQALPLSRGHLSLYQLTIEPGTAFQHAYAKGEFTLPEEENAAAMFELTRRMTTAYGLPAYEVSNHAAPGQESLHNLAYWRGWDYVGIGPGAHGRLSLNGQRFATETQKSPERWLEQAERDGHGLISQTPLTNLELLEERLMMGLRIEEGIAEVDFIAQLGQDFDTALPAQKLRWFQQQGLLERTPTHLRATPKGMLLLTRLSGELVS